jgi:hypothetical protein
VPPIVEIDRACRIRIGLESVLKRIELPLKLCRRKLKNLHVIAIRRGVPRQHQAISNLRTTKCVKSKNAQWEDEALGDRFFWTTILEA